jgi:hypothetical protein
MVYLTQNNGETWQNVTPPAVKDWSRIAMVEPSHFDAGTAYLAVNRHRLDDYTPYIYRTHDFGKTWTRINTGIEAPAYVHAVREDPMDRGLLFAGTETGVYVSFNDGDAWQSLQLNMPATPVRDLTLHRSDLVIATHGRSFWILDDIIPLRQAAGAAQASAFLFRPRTAYRVRPGNEHGTPLPPEIPAGDNPPDGAIIDYYLKTEPQGPVTLEILDTKGHVVRSYSSADHPKAPPASSLPFPAFWVKAPEALEKTPGMHRFTWDLQYASAAPSGRASFFRFGGGPWAVPGQYQVRLTVDGKSYTQPLNLQMDPRAQVSLADLQKQFDLAMRIETQIREAGQAIAETQGVEKQLQDRAERLAGAPANGGAKAALAAVRALESEMTALTTGGTAAAPEENLTEMRGRLRRIEGMVEGADAAPTATAQALFEQTSQSVDRLLAAWTEVKTMKLPAVNQQITGAGLPAIEIGRAPGSTRPPDGD